MDRCAVCGGNEAEHDVSQHMFTTKPGELITKEQHEKNQPKVAVPSTPSMPLSRLIEVLTVKKLLTLEEALYIAELGPRPDLEQYKEYAAW